MRKLISFFILSLAVLISYCGDNPAANTKDYRTSITVDTAYQKDTTLIAKGIIKNIGTDTLPGITITGSFYTDSTRLIKFGSAYYSTYGQLAPNGSTFWQLTFSSSIIDLDKYPNFIIGDLKAYPFQN